MEPEVSQATAPGPYPLRFILILSSSLDAATIITCEDPSVWVGSWFTEEIILRSLYPEDGSIRFLQKCWNLFTNVHVTYHKIKITKDLTNSIN
jgi:hypothetical protein